MKEAPVNDSFLEKLSFATDGVLAVKKKKERERSKRGGGSVTDSRWCNN